MLNFFYQNSQNGPLRIHVFHLLLSINQQISNLQELQRCHWKAYNPRIRMIDKSMYFEHLWTHLWYFLHRAVLSQIRDKGGFALEGACGRGGGAVGGHTTFRILSLLRYVVDIGKSSPNPKFFWNPMKTDTTGAYQSSKFGLFSCFWTTSWKIAKIITYGMVKTDVFVIET